MSMSTFLINSEVESAFRHVVAGRDLRCAVTSWNLATTVKLRSFGTDVNRFRIICGLSNGECTPEALVALGAPHNGNLRHQPGLNANVYVSDRGAVIGSASCKDAVTITNQNHVEFLGAATYHRATSTTWQAAADWCDQLYDGARRLDIDALELARLKCSVRDRVAEWMLPKRGSLLDLVLEKPELFDGMGFAIRSKTTTEKDRSRARQNAVASGIASQDVIESFSSEGIFTGVSSSDARRWPASFLEIRLLNDVLKTFPRVVCAIDVSNGTIFTKRNPTRLSYNISEGLLCLQDVQRSDVDRIRLLRDAGAGLFPTAVHLALAIEKLPAYHHRHSL